MSARSSGTSGRSDGLYNTVTTIFVALSLFLCVFSLLLFARIVPVPAAFNPRTYLTPIATANTLPTPTQTPLPSETPIPSATFTPLPPSATPPPTVTLRPSITPFPTEPTSP